MSDRPFLILIVIDGFGCRKEAESNAIAEAETPCFDRLYRESAWTTLEASGRAVGLPRDQFSATFAVSRIAGWSAHVLEQRRTGRLIRPASHYTGRMP